MTNNKTTKDTNMRKEQFQKATKKTLESITPMFSRWWSFMKTKIGPGWSIIIVLSGLYGICHGYIISSLLYVFVAAPLAMLILKYARPDVILTTGSLFQAKFAYDVLYPAMALAVAAFCTIGIASAQKQQEDLQPNYEYACSEEGIKKSGKAGCQKAKEKFSAHLKERLTTAQKNYKEESRLTDQYSKEKAQKCTENGIVEYGSDGCNEATNNLEQHTKLRDEYKQKVESLEQKINELKK